MKLLATAKNCRPRERLSEKGAQSLSDAELLALLLGSGTRKMNVLDVSSNILKDNTLQDLSRAPLSKLSAMHGIGKVKASQITACFELARRLFSSSNNERKRINCASDVAEMFFPRLSFLKRENLVAIYLDSRRKVMREEVISSGGIDSTVISPKEIFSNAITEKASAIILVHNHPSGESSPSEEDISMTKEISAAGDLLGIEILDHVIIGNGNYSSLREQGLLDS